MQAILGIGAFIALIVLALRGNAGASERPSLPESLPEGLPKPSTVTNEDVKAIEAEINKTAKAVPAPSLVLSESPFADVQLDKWGKFVKAMKTLPLNNISPGYGFGMFNMGMRALGDIGLVSNLHQGKYDGRNVWLGDWNPPLTQDTFLSNPNNQLKAFTAFASYLEKAIRSRYMGFIGQKIGNVPTTLSGLIAVGYYAGLGGLDSWLNQPMTRKAATTAYFNKYNGIF